MRLGGGGRDTWRAAVELASAPTEEDALFFLGERAHVQPEEERELGRSLQVPQITHVDASSRSTNRPATSSPSSEVLLLAAEELDITLLLAGVWAATSWHNCCSNHVARVFDELPIPISDMQCNQTHISSCGLPLCIQPTRHTNNSIE